MIDPNSPAILGELVMPGPIQDIELAGGYAYLADLYDGLRVVDIANPSSPVEVGFCDTAGRALGVAIQGSYAFVADDENGVRVIDISVPSSPLEIGGLRKARATGEQSADVQIAGNIAYESYRYSDPWWGSWAGLRIYDITDPLNPAPVSSYDSGQPPKRMAIQGGLLFSAADGHGLRIVDISDPAAPVEVGFFEPDEFEAKDVAVVDDRAYVAAGWGGMVILDVSDPTAPHSVGAGSGQGTFAQRIVVSGDHAYLAREDDGFGLVDIADPLAPVELAAIDTGDAMGDLRIRGDLAYVTQRSDVLRVLDVSDPTTPVEIGVADFHADFWYDHNYRHAHLALGANHAYIAGSEKLWIVDITDPTHPSARGTLELADRTADLALAGDYLYLANTSAGLQVVDVSDPWAPTVVATYDPSGVERRVEIAGNYAYLSNDAHGLRILDISDPLSPGLVGAIDLNLDADGLAIAGDYAYISWYWQIFVVDISNPAAPVEVADFWPGARSRGFSAHDGRLYIAGDESGVLVWDVADPLHPVSAESFDTGEEALGVDSDGERIYAVDSKAGLWILGSPLTPVLLTTFDTAAWPGEVRATWMLAAESEVLGFRLIREHDSEGQAEVAWQEDAPGRFQAIDRSPSLLRGGAFRYSLYGKIAGEGWELLRSELVAVPPVDESRLLAPHPNPFNPTTELAFVLAESAPVHLSIFDLAGRRVTSLLEGVPHAAGRHAVRWDGRDGSGQRLPSGVYFARFCVGAHREEARLVILK